jgi:hypothetical protein
MYFSHGPLHFLEKASIRYVFTSHTNYYKFSSTINTISKYTGIIKLHGTYAIVQNFTTLHPFNPTRCPVQQEVRQIRRSSRSPFLHYSSNFLANSRDQYSQTMTSRCLGLLAPLQVTNGRWQSQPSRYISPSSSLRPQPFLLEDIGMFSHVPRSRDLESVIPSLSFRQSTTVTPTSTFSFSPTFPFPTFFFTSLHSSKVREADINISNAFARIVGVLVGM